MPVGNDTSVNWKSWDREEIELLAEIMFLWAGGFASEINLCCVSHMQRASGNRPVHRVVSGRARQHDVMGKKNQRVSQKHTCVVPEIIPIPFVSAL